MLACAALKEPGRHAARRNTEARRDRVRPAKHCICTGLDAEAYPGRWCPRRCRSRPSKLHVPNTPITRCVSPCSSAIASAVETRTGAGERDAAARAREAGAAGAAGGASGAGAASRAHRAGRRTRRRAVRVARADWMHIRAPETKGGLGEGHVIQNAWIRGFVTYWCRRATGRCRCQSSRRCTCKFLRTRSWRCCSGTACTGWPGPG